MNVTRLCEYVGCDDAILMKVHDLLGYASVIIVPTEVFITETARDELPQEAVVRALSRHFRGDWGDVNEDIRRLNSRALRMMRRVIYPRTGTVISKYSGQPGQEFFVVTEGGPINAAFLEDDTYYPWADDEPAGQCPDVDPPALITRVFLSYE